MNAVTATISGPSVKRRERPEPKRHVVERRRVDGTIVDEVVLDPQIFGLEPNVAVMHQVVTAQLAAARAGTQSTRTRAEVSGGGAKPFRQKGTGRARQGSIRAPQWEGGGIALGPKPRSYNQRTPKKMIRLALLSALSDRAAESRVALVDDWTIDEPRTKDAVAALDALGIGGRVLVVLGPDDGIADRSFANIPRVQCVQQSELSAYDVLRSDWIVFTDATILGETETVTAARPARSAAAAKKAETAKKAPATKKASAQKRASASQDSPAADESSAGQDASANEDASAAGDASAGEEGGAR